MDEFPYIVCSVMGRDGIFQAVAGSVWCEPAHNISGIGGLVVGVTYKAALCRIIPVYLLFERKADL